MSAATNTTTLSTFTAWVEDQKALALEGMKPNTTATHSARAATGSSSCWWSPGRWKSSRTC